MDEIIDIDESYETIVRDKSPEIIDIDELKKVKGKPVLEIPEHSIYKFKVDQKKIFPFNDQDINKEKQLNKFGIIFTQTPEGINISTYFYVCIQEFSNFILKVTPKQVGEIEQLGKMIAFCYMDKEDMFFNDESILFQEEKNGPLEWLIIKFTKDCQKLIKTGLYKRYETFTDNVPYLKGKLLIKEQIQNNMKFNMKFHCEYDEFTSNNLENQIILYTLKKCLKISEMLNLKTLIQKLIHHIDKQIEDKQITSLDFKKIHYTKLNKNYKSPLNLSKLILKYTGFKNINEMRAESISPFVINMPDLFETFVQKLFKEYYLNFVREQYSTKPWTKEGKEESDKKLSMIPDLVFFKDKLEDGGKTIYENIKFVMDAKYMKDLKRDGRYQIAFYLNEYKKVNGFAMCPTLKDTFTKKNGQVCYEDKDKYLLQLERQGKKITVQHINVDQFLKEVLNKPENEIRAIVESIIQTSN